MTSNMCGIDRVIRFILGILLVSVALFIPAISDDFIIQCLVIGFAAINFLSSLMSFCPVYAVAGFDTRKNISNPNQD
jgi:hypothetical protein